MLNLSHLTLKTLSKSFHVIPEKKCAIWKIALLKDSVFAKIIKKKLQAEFRQGKICHGLA